MGGVGVRNVAARAFWVSLVPIVLAALLLASGDEQLSTSAQSASPHPRVFDADRSDTTAPLRDLPTIPPQAGGPVGEINKRKLLPNRVGSSGASGPDPVLQAPGGGVSAPTTSGDFEGVGNVDGVLPPDTTGDVGPNHYVQMVNLSFAVWDKSGTLLYGPVSNNTLWQGFGGACELTNDGDAVVLYDHLADRWLISQFALPNFPSGPFYQCIAVSQTGDPLGSWHRYAFQMSNTKLNDYGKFGVWPDGYYFTANQFKCNVLFCTWAGQLVVAFERDAMLNGQAARGVGFDLQNFDSTLSAMLPSDLDGPPPPAGAPNPFCQIDDDAWGYSPDQIQCWDFHVDWADTSATTFTLSGAMNTSAFDSNLCDYGRNCIPQPGGTDVDAISDRLMYRQQYRNFGSHQALVVNHTVDVNGADRAGVRWYELRNSGAGWSIYQQGTFSPDADNRWMGSVAMNGQEEIGLGYSVSSASVSPSVRVTGRLPSDALGTLPQGEATIVAGAGYQEHESGRWGDYSTMSVDPTDDCTFWYTQEYYAAVSSSEWQTRIGSFYLGECSDADHDGDGIFATVEAGCGSNAWDPGSIPERVDGSFADADDDGDTLIDEALPAGADAFDCDGDGYAGAAEANVYSYVGQISGDQKTCGEYHLSHPNPNADTKPSLRWPSDLRKGGIPDSTDRINILDLASFVAPLRYLGSNVGTNPGDVRWDLSPGPGVLSTDINILDFAQLTAPASPTGAPPMLGGARAFNGPPCSSS